MAFALSLIAGLLLPLSIAPFDLWPLALLAAAALFVAAEGPGARFSARRLAALGFCFGLGKYGLGASWVFVSIHEYGNASVPLALFLVALFVAVLALFPLTQFLAYGRLRARAGTLTNRLLLFAGLFVLWEWFLTFVLSGFPWLFLGSGQLRSPLAGYAPIGGVLLQSLAAVLSGALLGLAWLVRSRGTRGVGPPLALSLTIIGTGAAAAQIEWTRPGPVREAALVQGNVDQKTKWNAAQRQPILDRMVRLTEPHWDVDLILWPEAALTLYEHQAEPLLDRWAARGAAANTALVLGLPGVEVLPGAGETPSYRFSNLAVAVGSSRGRYEKRRLVPFGEYVPLEDWLRGLIAFFDLPMSHAVPGPPQQALLPVGREQAAMAICYEVAYPGLVQGDMPADVLLTISNDAWFGRSLGPEQHRQLAQLRALELGRNLLRATNTGYTVIVDHRGRVTAELPRFEASVLRGSYEIRQGLTPFARFGSGPVLIIVLCFVAVVFLRALKKPAEAESSRP